MSHDLGPGDEAPDFSLPASGGKTVSLADFRGKPLVLYFYPKDSVAKHDKFAEKHGLKIMLASDEESDVCERYGVWTEKAMYGRKYMGIERSTFLIDGDGRIAEAWRKVKVPGHVDKVLAAVRTLKEGNQ